MASPNTLKNHRADMPKPPQFAWVSGAKGRGNGQTARRYDNPVVDENGRRLKRLTRTQKKAAKRARRHG